ncbi:MAG: hypothetical protein II943_02200 [Victivallales bacterium]|nr:hypothetical protein [Victivallales bacterium]
MKKAFLCLAPAILLASSLILTSCGSNSSASNEESAISPAGVTMKSDSPLSVAKAFMDALSNFELDKASECLTGDANAVFERELFEKYTKASEEEKEKLRARSKLRNMTIAWGEKRLTVTRLLLSSHVKGRVTIATRHTG